MKRKSEYLNQTYIQCIDEAIEEIQYAINKSIEIDRAIIKWMCFCLRLTIPELHEIEHELYPHITGCPDIKETRWASATIDGEILNLQYPATPSKYVEECREALENRIKVLQHLRKKFE